jgi:hypothetical protein
MLTSVLAPGVSPGLLPAVYSGEPPGPGRDHRDAVERARANVVEPIVTSATAAAVAGLRA